LFSKKKKKKKKLFEKKEGRKEGGRSDEWILLFSLNNEKKDLDPQSGDEGFGKRLRRLRKSTPQRKFQQALKFPLFGLGFKQWKSDSS
jgi:hypothetical protein